VISPYANLTHEQALGVEDNNATGSASNRGNPVCHVLLEETGSNELGKLLKAPNHTPLRASIHHLFRVTGVGPWVEGSKGMRREGVDKFTMSFVFESL